MPITFPRELPDVGYVTADVALRDAVTASPAGKGLINYTDVAPPVWEASLTTRGLVESQKASVEAWWLSLRGGLRSVLFRHPHVCYPKNHAGNPTPALTAGRVASISFGNVLAVDGVDPALSLVPGDRIGLEHANRWYVGRLTDVSGSGTSRTLIVEPPPPSNIAQVSAVVRWVRPGCLMRPVPDSFQAARNGRFYTVSFKLTEVFGTGSVPRDMYWNFTSAASVGTDFSRASGGTYWGADGLLKTAASNEPRIEYDPVTHEWLGLLAEEARTNLLWHSEALDNPYWIKVAATIVADDAVAPDGLMTADKLVSTTDNDQHQAASPNVALAKNVVYTYSAFVRAAEYSKILLQMNAFGGNIFNARFDLVAGTKTNSEAGNAVVMDSTITALGSGWYRCSITGTPNTADASTGVQTAVVLLNDSMASTFPGDGVSGLHVWGQQLETGGYASSYIKTGAAAGTRAADFMTRAANDWLNADEGTLYVEFSPLSDGAPTSGIIALGDPTTNGNVLNIARSVGGGLGFYSGVGGVNQLSGSFIGGVATPAGQTKKAALAYRKDDYAWALAGVLGTDTSGDVPPVSELRIGRRDIAATYANSHIRRIVYFARRLSNEELVSLTS